MIMIAARRITLLFGFLLLAVITYLYTLAWSTVSYQHWLQQGAGGRVQMKRDGNATMNDDDNYHGAIYESDDDVADERIVPANPLSLSLSNTLSFNTIATAEKNREPTLTKSNKSSPVSRIRQQNRGEKETKQVNHVDNNTNLKSIVEILTPNILVKLVKLVKPITPYHRENGSRSSSDNTELNKTEPGANDGTRSTKLHMRRFKDLPNSSVSSSDDKHSTRQQDSSRDRKGGYSYSSVRGDDNSDDAHHRNADPKIRNELLDLLPRSSRRISPGSPSLHHLLKPLALLAEYKQQHSVQALRAELKASPEQFHRRNFAVGPFQCPYQAGMMTLPYLNTFLLALATNRTFLFQYVGRDKNSWETCGAIVSIQDWLPTFDEFYPIIVQRGRDDKGAESNKQLNDSGGDGDGPDRMQNPNENTGQMAMAGFNTTASFSSQGRIRRFPSNIPIYSQLWPSRCTPILAAYQNHIDMNQHNQTNRTTTKTILSSGLPVINTTSVPFLAHHKIVQASRLFSPLSPYGGHWVDLRHPCTSLILTQAWLLPIRPDAQNNYDTIATPEDGADSDWAPAVVPFHQQTRIHDLYSQGAGFLQGMMYFATVQFTERLYQTINPADWVASPEAEVFSVGMHSRHPGSSKSGEVIDLETKCLDLLIQQHQFERRQQGHGSVRLPCRVYLMSDRNATIQGVADYARSRYQCDVVYTHNAVAAVQGRKIQAEHGPTAGMGYFQDILVIGIQARSAYMSHFRSSSLLPLATMEYYRRIEAATSWQKDDSMHRYDYDADSSLRNIPEMALCSFNKGGRLLDTSQVMT